MIWTIFNWIFLKKNLWWTNFTFIAAMRHASNAKNGMRWTNNTDTKNTINRYNLNFNSIGNCSQVAGCIQQKPPKVFQQRLVSSRAATPYPYVHMLVYEYVHSAHCDCTHTHRVFYIVLNVLQSQLSRQTFIKLKLLLFVSIFPFGRRFIDRHIHFSLFSGFYCFSDQSPEETSGDGTDTDTLARALAENNCI